jgi:hypothetical protein
LQSSLSHVVCLEPAYHLQFFWGWLPHFIAWVFIGWPVVDLNAAWVQAWSSGDGKAAASLSKKGKEFGEKAKSYRQAANDQVQ